MSDYHSTPMAMLVALEEQLAAIDQPIHTIGELLRVDVRRMRRRLGGGDEPICRFVSRGREGFTRFGVLVVKNVGVGGGREYGVCV